MVTVMVSRVVASFVMIYLIEDIDSVSREREKIAKPREAYCFRIVSRRWHEEDELLNRIRYLGSRDWILDLSPILTVLPKLCLVSENENGI